MAKRKDDKTPVTGGAVIIDDGPGKIDALVSPGDIQIKSYFELKGIEGGTRHVLPKDPAYLLVGDRYGNEFKYLRKNVTGFTVETDAEEFVNGDLQGKEGKVVIFKGSNHFAAKEIPKINYAYELIFSGKIKAVTVNGEAIQGGNSLTLWFDAV